MHFHPAHSPLSLRGRAAKICDKSCGNSISFEAFFNVYCHRPTLSRVFESWKDGSLRYRQEDASLFQYHILIFTHPVFSVLKPDANIIFYFLPTPRLLNPHFKIQLVDFWSHLNHSFSEIDVTRFKPFEFLIIILLGMHCCFWKVHFLYFLELPTVLLGIFGTFCNFIPSLTNLCFCTVLRPRSKLSGSKYYSSVKPEKVDIFLLTVSAIEAKRA